MNELYMLGRGGEIDGYDFVEPIGLYTDEYAACAAAYKRKKETLLPSCIIKVEVNGTIEPKRPDYDDFPEVSSLDIICDPYGYATKYYVSPEVWEWFERVILRDCEDDDKNFIRMITDDERAHLAEYVNDYKVSVINDAMRERDEFLRTGKLPN